MQISLFDQVDDVVRALVPDELGAYRSRTHRRGIKVWFGPEKATTSHYEAQVLARRHVDGIEGLALEVGFHAEHGDQNENQAALDRLLAAETTWRKTLGAEAESGEFFDAPHWRRLSEAWIEPDLEDPELAFEIASRLVDYLTALQPHLPDA
jgi:hypothetical protein